MSGSKLSDPTAVRASPSDEPLGLTVHSLPLPGQVAAHDAGRTRSGRLKMLVVMLVCAAPVVASYFTYYVIRPEGRRNFGDLIEPQRALPALRATGLHGDSTVLSALKGQWLLVSVGGGACGDGCQRHLYLQRQLREILGKDKDRLDWVWLIPDDTPVAESLRPGIAQATVLRVPRADLAAWLTPAVGRQLEDHLYLVDPLGNWMMRFPAGLDTAGAAQARKDLERLMRASNSWDKAGR